MRPGCERFAADFARRTASRWPLTGGEPCRDSQSCWSVWWVRWELARVDWSLSTEAGVALPEEEPVEWRKRDMPSAGILGSLLGVVS